ncbi:enoyl-CoA hydratase/isomerase family protein [Saccharopolyspora sp. ID03-671]|uniref:enoyl-CoA hydratase/isomerase family protein n=1 Tax=Saccharopolyspora sp. ID03-671 TaxID=3073066 RepID=UPI00324F60C8
MAESVVDAGLLDRGGVGLTIHGRRATITLDRPDKLNAQTPHTWQALREIGRSLGAEIRVVVLRGAGRAFSAGLDRRMFSPDGADGAPGLAALAERPTEQSDAEIGGYQQAFSWLREPDRVTIAAVQGHAIGAGFQLALACDLRVLADDARLRMAETGLGLVPDLGGTLPLVRAVGYARAVDICVTGREVTAEEALDRPGQPGRGTRPAGRGGRRTRRGGDGATGGRGARNAVAAGPGGRGRRSRAAARGRTRGPAAPHHRAGPAARRPPVMINRC